MKRKCFLILLILCAYSLIVGQNTDKPNSEQVIVKVVSDRTYNDVLDIVFPREIKQKKETVWQFVLRFKPNSAPESQITIRKTITGYEVLNFSVSNGIIFSKINQIFTTTNKEDISEMVNAIQVEKTKVEIAPKEINLWYDLYFKSIPLSSQALKFSSQEFDRTNGSWSVRLHGTYYELWFLYKGNQICFIIYDEEIDQNKITGENALVKWMNKVRLKIK